MTDAAHQPTTVPAYATERADYGRLRDAEPEGAVVLSVRVDSPAYDAGIEPGMHILAVNGMPLRDMIDWLWEASDEAVILEVLDPRDGARDTCELERFPDEDWGIAFDGAVFDGMRTCVNACTFCFMHMLPPHMRDTLYIRDDDYRLSFLQGNFVTLTNMSDDDVERVISQRLSPMNVSLHAVDPDVRRALMGRNAARGMVVLERLIAADIEIHAQVVLLPGVNDGVELDRTLAWCAARPQVTSLGIVPLGYTRYQYRFTASYSDNPAAARAVIEQVRPYQEAMRRARGQTVFQLGDEFYLDSGVSVPPAETYDGYPQFYDGIGMVRSYLDETDELIASEGDRLARVHALRARSGKRLAVVSGQAAASIVARLVASEAFGGTVVAIKNRYFGGNVDVTGLICAEDLLEQLPDDLIDVMLFVPDVMFNADGLTLDGYHRTQLARELERRGAYVRITSTLPGDLLDSVERALIELKGDA